MNYWKTFEQEIPSFDDYINVSTNGYVSSGHFQNIEESFQNPGEDIIEIKNGMPVFHEGKFVKFVEPYSFFVNDSTKWQKVILDH